MSISELANQLGLEPQELRQVLREQISQIQRERYLRARPALQSLDKSLRNRAAVIPMGSNVRVYYCSECGTDTRTPRSGCQLCRKRERERQRLREHRDGIYVPPYLTCARCGTDIDNYSPDCKTCQSRRRERARREREKRALPVT